MLQRTREGGKQKIQEDKKKTDVCVQRAKLKGLQKKSKGKEKGQNIKGVEKLKINKFRAALTSYKGMTNCSRGHNDI